MTHRNITMPLGATSSMQSHHISPGLGPSNQNTDVNYKKQQ
jgi:hypothetical protein